MPAELATGGQIPLPFAEKEYIDAPRAARILDVSHRTVLRLAASRMIEMIEYRENARKKIVYASVVRLCDRLREEFLIPDRRPPLSSQMFRHKDEDLLPFPASDTMGAQEALSILGFQSIRPLLKIIEEGKFEAYRLVKWAPWRISRTSFTTYIISVRNGRPNDPRAYHELAVSHPRLYGHR